MAQPNTVRPGKMRILIDGDAPCGMTTKGLTITKNLSEVTIPDCDDPDAPYWMARDVESLSMSISGDGVLATESYDTWKDAAYTTLPIDASVEIEFGSGTRVFFGKWHLDSLQINAEQGQRVSVSISLQSDGEITHTFNPS